MVYVCNRQLHSLILVRPPAGHHVQTQGSDQVSSLQTSPGGGAEGAAVDPKLKPWAGETAAVAAADEAGVAAGVLDAAAVAMPKDRGVEVEAVVAGSGVLTA